VIVALAILGHVSPQGGFKWRDQLDYTPASWCLDRDGEFRRVERVVHRHGMTRRRP
jgi:hypothetical protein